MLAQASKQSPRNAGISCCTEAAFDVALYSLVSFEVSRDEIGSFFRTDTKLLGQSIRSLTVDDAEIDRLCAVSLSRGDLVHRNSEYVCRSSTVYVFTAVKRFGEASVTGQM